MYTATVTSYLFTFTGTTHELDHDPLTLSKDDMDRVSLVYTSMTHSHIYLLHMYIHTVGDRIHTLYFIPSFLVYAGKKANYIW